MKTTQGDHGTFLPVVATYCRDEPGKKVSGTSNTKFLRNRRFGKRPVLMFF